ncbi:complex I subunit 5 family protein [Natronincola ferrireducens]|uniref:Formate hydrogenlyase subunit 3/Multisubunit Na+/H+ antiporter, MnhD subunit n=1 Tax=Natronincola ferrireducens TaxID=393762 RepID=A0A1G9G548_9FIRM|nr:complex I subunit 5 family protein [Natronincola ferrireducens]SDK95789.1 Formate hydrogenlyase subunit 3/Multisubunit Na+/H+ antiporter, MnhD subunit [Natronincola ferrireducens]
MKATGMAKKLRGLKHPLDYFSINCILIFFISIIFIFGFVVFTLPGLEGNGLQKLVKVGPEFIDFITNFKELPLLVVLFSLISGPIEATLGKRSETLRDSTVVDNTFISLIMTLAMYPQVAQGKIEYTIKGLFGYGLHFHVDMLSFIMAATAGILWFLVSIYAHDYMPIEQHRNRFYLWMSITYGGILGTVMAGDLLTMFLFFELMTFSSYMLVAHNQSKESILAGDSYIYMGVVGGLCILLGMILLITQTNTLHFVPLAAALKELGGMKYLITGLFVFGFGIKAGMLPLHIWLPKAHPVAPTPASALLSGILIKVGAYGILRVATSILVPSIDEIIGYKDPLWEVSQKLGVLIIWLGIITMVVGVFMALQQSNMKKMLAYHSISQMGYIIMGIGVAAYLGYKGAMGFSGSIYHIINHALFKALLFMAVGLVYLRTHELDMYKLGGLWRKMPFTAFVTIIAALGITGMPGFNGFASKSILHHAIIEAYEYGHPSFRYAEMIFTVVSAGTVCSFIKLFSYVFLGKCPEKYEKIDGEKGMMDMAMAGLAMLIIAVGQAPNYILNQFIIPAARSLTYDPAFIDKYLVDMNFFNSKDLTGMIWVYLLGIAIFILGKKYHLFHLHLPTWMSFENVLYRPIYRGVLATANTITERYEVGIIKSDVVIYTLILTSTLLLLIRFG